MRICARCGTGFTTSASAHYSAAVRLKNIYGAVARYH